SCKELTAAAYILPYLGIAAAGWRRTSGDPEARRRFLRSLAATLAAVPVAYALVNVVYAPASWWEHVQIWLSGPGKDPAVWAPPGYTLQAYLWDVWAGLCQN